MKVEIPDKLYFKIGEVAKFADVAPHVIRYWESEFDKIKPKRANSRQRLFRREDVDLILNIKDLLHHQGFTISGAKKFLAAGKSIPDDVADNSFPTSSILPKKVDKNGLLKIKNELLEIKGILDKSLSR